jgi:hypothetical protein
VYHNGNSLAKLNFTMSSQIEKRLLLSRIGRLILPGWNMDTWGVNAKYGYGGALENFKFLKNFD